MPSNVQISGAGIPEVNGVYVYEGEHMLKPSYLKIVNGEHRYRLFWTGNQTTARWQIWDLYNTHPSGQIRYQSGSTSYYPWEIPSFGWVLRNLGVLPLPTITELPVIVPVVRRIFSTLRDDGRRRFRRLRVLGITSHRPGLRWRV